MSEIRKIVIQKLAERQRVSISIAADIYMRLPLRKKVALCAKEAARLKKRSRT